MAVKLHRCSNMWVKLSGHPCWRVQKALDEQGVEYEIVKGPWLPGKRSDLEQLSGQRKYPVIEFEDGTSYRAESKEMAQRIRDGKLFEGHGGTTAPPGAGLNCAPLGAIAQLGERLDRTQEVGGSSPPSSISI